MNLRTNDIKNVLFTAGFGFLGFASLAVGNLLVKRKLVSSLKVDSPNLAKHDETLMIYLSDVEAATYDHDPVAYIRLVDTCDRIVAMRSDLVAQKIDIQQFADVRIDVFLQKERMEENVQRLEVLARKLESISCLKSLEEIANRIGSHTELIYMLTIEKS